MNRRQLLIGGGACGALATGRAFSQAVEYVVPERFSKPEVSTDEGGLWALVDREEKNLRRSPFLLKDTKLKAYVQDIACRLGGSHCPDIRVHLVRTPLFNANMAPNGMMQVWSGLLLRVDNEAQLAAVLGHEIGHYLQKHSVERLRDMKAKSAFGQFLGIFGLVGAVGQLAVLASAFAYGREHEREADRIGAFLMHQAGYDVSEAAKVWHNLLDEAKARDGKEPEKYSPLFATHPASPEREETLRGYALALPGGVKGDEAYRAATTTLIPEWLDDEVKRGQFAESLVLLSRLTEQGRSVGYATFSRGEVYRLRGEQGDLDKAVLDYQAALALADGPPQALRGIGLIARQRGDAAMARDNLGRYLERVPTAPDAALIKSYLTELES